MSGRGPIIETVVSTLGDDGAVNCAAMGVEWASDDALVIRPWGGTRTLRNLRAYPEAVVHLTDDVLLFCRAALGSPHPAVRPAATVRGSIVVGVASWREVRVRTLDDAGERATVHVDVVDRGRDPDVEPLGLNRARHAAVEASILASRLRFLGADEVERRLEELDVLVEKTAGPVEREAMAYVRDHVRRRTGATA